MRAPLTAIWRLCAIALTLLALIAIATRPLWSSAQFFYSDDALLHLFRVFAFDRTLQQGVVYPRWVLDLAFGYGYPIFNFYPPLSAYLVETLHVFGLGFAEAIKGAFIGIVALGAVGAYVMGTELFRREKNRAAVGLLTAVAYVFFPYFLSNIYMRGALAEALAAAVLPWLVWSLRNALTRQTVSALILVALFLAIQLVAHSLTLLMAAPILGLYVFLEWFRLPSANRIKGLVLLAAASILGAELGAIYWLPFLAELPWVKMGRGIAEIQGYFQTTIHFQTLSSLVQPSWFYKYSAAPFALGLVPVILGVLAAAAALGAGRALKGRGTVFFFSIVALVGAMAMVESSREVWQRVPAATMVQYPWRVSVLIGLSLSIVIGSLPIALSKIRLLQQVQLKLLVRVSDTTGNVLHLAIVVICALAIVWAAIARLSPQPVFMASDPTPAQLARFEEISGFIGTTTFGEYLPTTVKAPNLVIHAPQEEQAANPSPADIRMVQYGPTERSFSVSASTLVSVSLRALYFPDWRVTVDNRPAVAYPSTPMGLVTVDVPAGEHRVAFSLGDTLPRQLGSLISLAGAVTILVLVLFAVRRREAGLRAVLLVIGMTFAIMAPPTAVALTAHPSTPQSVQMDFSPSLRAIGLDIPGARFESGVWHISNPRDLVHLQVYWQVRQLLQDQPITWQLRDGADRVRAERRQLSRYGTGSMSTWIPNEVVEDEYDLPLNGTMSAGRYTLHGVYGDNNAYLPLGVIELDHGYRPSPLIPEIKNRFTAQLGDEIELLGYDMPRSLQPGTRFPVTLWWQADRDILHDYTSFVELLDVTGKVAARPRYEGTQFDGLNPSSLWIPGQFVVDRRVLDLPANMKPGLYYWAVGMERYPDHEPLPAATDGGPLPGDVVVLREVKVPMDAPRIQPEHPLQLSVGSTIRLLGYDLQVQDIGGNVTAQGDDQIPSRVQAHPGQSIALTLYWQAVSKVEADYKVFVHIEDENGKPALQQDQSPDEWRYPTRIWDAGESVIDPHRLSLSNLAAGLYRIRVGIYEPASGERLSLSDGRGNELKDRQVEIGLLEVIGP